MVKLENECFLRLYLLLIKGGGEVLRQIILWGLERQKLTLEEFLSLKKDLIIKLERIKQTEVEILYPGPPDVSDLSKWDLSLLSFIAMEFFKKNLKDTELKAVEKMKEMRNKYAHHADASIDFSTYNSEWTELTLVIYTLAHEMDESKKEYLREMITNLAQHLDIRTAIDELKALDRTEELSKRLDEVKTELSEIKKDVVQDISDIKKKVQDIPDIKKAIQELKEQLESLGKSTNITNKSRGAIYVNAADQGAEESAESLLVAAATDCVSRSEPAESNGAVKEKIEKIVEDIEGKGVKVEDVTAGSIVFSFQCSSLTSLIDLLDFFESTDLQNHLDEVSSVVEDILGHKVQLTAFMLPESLQDTVKTLESMTEKPRRSLQFSMTCRGVEGLQHALDVFEGEAASNSINDLAKTLSEEVGKPVTIETSIDIGEMQKAIQSTKQQLENELRAMQTDGSEATGYDSDHAYDEISKEELLDSASENTTEVCTGQLEDESIRYEPLEADLDDFRIYGKRSDSPQSLFQEKTCRNCGNILTTESEICKVCDGKTEAENADISTETSRVVKSSDMMHDFACTPCSDDGRNTEAYKYCADCQSYYCKTCLHQHSKFPALKKHILLDWTDIEDATRQDKTKLPVVALPSDFCSEHPGNVIQIYCREHDVVCCTVCIALVHRLCEGVEFIPKIATHELTEGRERKEVEASLSETWRELERKKNQMSEEISRLNDAQYDIFKEIQNLKARLLAKLSKLEKNSVDQVRTEQNAIVEKINMNVSEIEQMLKFVDTHRKNITNFKGVNDAQLFVYIKQGQKLVSKCSDLLQEIKNSPTAMLKFDLSYDFEVSLNEMQSFISLHTNDFDRTSFVGEYEVRLQSDICNVTACCILDDGTLIITDTNNNRLKRLDQSYRLMNWCDAPGGPSGLCQVGTNEIAVSMYYGQKVQYASIGDEISLKGSFPVNEGCLGICYSQDKLFIVCTGIQFVGTVCYRKKGTGHVRVYDLSGQLLRSIETDENGQKIFLEPNNIAVCRNGINVYITDVQAGLIILDPQGNKQAVITDPNLKGAFDVCLGDLDRVFVCGRMSHNVLQLDNHGQIEREILRQTDGLLKPISIMHKQNSNHLIVSCENTEKLKVFKLN